MPNDYLGEVSNNETLIVPVTVLEADTGTGFDLTGADLTFAIHDHTNGHRNVVSVTSDDGGIDTTNAASGVLVIRIEASQMGSLCGREYAWELHAEFPGDDAVSQQGTITITEGYV